MPETMLGAHDVPEIPPMIQDEHETTAGGLVMTETTQDVPGAQPATDDRALLTLVGDAVLAVDGVARLEPTLKSLFLARVPGSTRDAGSPDGIQLTSHGAITDVTVDLATAGALSSREVAEAVRHVVGQLLETHGREPGRIQVNVLTIERRS